MVFTAGTCTKPTHAARQVQAFYPQGKKQGAAWSKIPSVRKQLDIIQKLFDEATEIIVATDAGREGELIFRYIYYYLKCKKPFKRLWISSQTDAAIKEGFRNLKPGS
jgi:DNA topoisomerase IA